MKRSYLVEIELPKDWVFDETSDVEAITDAVWELFPFSPRGDIMVSPYRSPSEFQGTIFAGPGPDDMGPQP